MKEAYICFTRIPQAGQVKTRLMPFLSPEQCAALQAAMLRDIAGQTERLHADIFVCHTGLTPGILRDIFPHAGFFPQSADESLGLRMYRALCHVLSLGYGACVLTGSDLPYLSAAHIESAFNALLRSDIVLGPTKDGGYYLVGLKAPCPALFMHKRYGHTSVYSDAVAAAKAAGKSSISVAACNDIDTADDLRALWAANKCNGSHTAAFLKTVFQKEEP